MKRNRFLLIISSLPIFFCSATQTMEKKLDDDYDFWKQKSLQRTYNLVSKLLKKTSINFYVISKQIISEKFNNFPGNRTSDSPRIGSARHAFLEGTKPWVPIISLYKIHLMPRDNKLENAAIKLSKLIQNNPELKDAINVFKIIPMYEQFQKILEARGDKSAQAPKIVIYVMSKAKTQTVLNKIYENFKDWPGVGREPSFNEKVTDFIFFAQGDRVDKINYPDLFEKSGVYFRPDIVKGEILDFHLINPAQS